MYRVIRTDSDRQQRTARVLAVLSTHATVTEAAAAMMAIDDRRLRVVDAAGVVLRVPPQQRAVSCAWAVQAERAEARLAEALDRLRAAEGDAS